MDDSTDRRVVVVTGANEGIGYHLLCALRDDGYRVAGLDVNGDALEPLQAAHPDEVRYYECDVTVDGDVEDAIADVVERWGRIDVLVNNAAVFEFGSFESGSLDAMRREFEVNVFGCARTIRAVLPHMTAAGGGIVHNVSSGVAFVGHPGLSGYAATKGAVEGLSRTLREELREENVAVTVVHPPLTDTRSAAEIGYPSSLLTDPETVGRKLARKIESRGPVVYVDWQTRFGEAFARRFPWLARRGTARFVDLDGGAAE